MVTWARCALPTLRSPKAAGRSGGAIHFGGNSSGSRADFADDPIAALAHVAGAATAHAGLLDDRSGAVVVNRKSFAEIHLHGLVCYEYESAPEIIDGPLRPRRGIA
jgi:hypothetical protein